MPDFRNVSDLAKYISGSSQVLSEGSIESALVDAAQLLEKILKEEINNYYSSYSPSVYVRTHDWINSIRVSKPTISGMTMSISIYFDDSMAYHPSVISEKYPDGYVITLMDTGWHWSSDKQPRINRFSDFSGIHYIEKSISRFNSQNKWGFKVSVETGYAQYL